MLFIFDGEKASILEGRIGGGMSVDNDDMSLKFLSGSDGARGDPPP